MYALRSRLAASAAAFLVGLTSLVQAAPAPSAADPGGCCPATHCAPPAIAQACCPGAPASAVPVPSSPLSAKPSPGADGPAFARSAETAAAAAVATAFSALEHLLLKRPHAPPYLRNVTFRI